MQTFLTFVEKRQIASTTMECVFEKPDGFIHKAGQNMTLVLEKLNYADARGARRIFTIVSAPFEEELKISTRMTGSGFKRTLAELPRGAKVQFSGPRGEFQLSGEHRKVIFVAGGIGITPIKSMITEAAHYSDLPQSILFYSNATLDEAAYHEFFCVLADTALDFIYVPTLTSSSKEDMESWTGERGRIDFEMITRHIKSPEECVFYLCGPPKMVDEISGVLEKNRIDKQHIFTESFWGYESIGN
jgi:ferredoxin-NADP reductase